MNLSGFRLVGRMLLSWGLVLMGLYVFLELTFFYYITWLFPLAALGHAGPVASLLAQYSKAGVYPENYIAILGDSYAYGQGDWLLEGEHRIRPSFSAAHLLHEQLHRDVISFGMPASDSVKSNNILPKVYRSCADAVSFFSLEDPELIIVYFYEGNDLNDNIEVAEKQIDPLLKGNKENMLDPVFFQHQVIPSLLNANELFRMASDISFSKKLPLFNLARNLVLDTYQKYYLGNRMDPWHPPLKGKTTAVIVNHQQDFLPDGIQTPALSLSRKEMDLGLYIFEQSLVWLHQEFPKARIGIAYIPAVITPYQVASESIHDYYRVPGLQKPHIQAATSIRGNSDYICSAVRQIALKQKLGFIDSRSRLRAVAKNRYIHGPIDWHHFNRLGYETLSEDLILLVKQLEQIEITGLPECQWEQSL